MVIGYYDAASTELVYRYSTNSGNTRKSRLILNGMLLQVGVSIFDCRNGKQIGAGVTMYAGCYSDIESIYSYEMLEHYGTGDCHKLSKILRQFSKYVITNEYLELGEESRSYILENIPQVINYLVRKLEDGHLKVYKLRFGKRPEEYGVTMFLDSEDPKNPVFLYPVFGLLAFSTEHQFVPWTPEVEVEEPELALSQSVARLNLNQQIQPEATSIPSASYITDMPQGYGYGYGYGYVDLNQEIQPEATDIPLGYGDCYGYYPERAGGDFLQDDPPMT